MVGQNHTRIILDDSILREQYVPTELTSREDQLKLVESCLEPARKGRKPTHVWLHGRPGSGKTAVARLALANLEQEARIASVRINCWERNSLYEILDQMVADLKIFHAEQHRSSIKLERIQQHLGNRCLIVLLDEVDKMSPSERARVLYSLDDLSKIALLCISSGLAALFDLEERVRSRINPRTIHCTPYSADQIAEILTRRANLALAPGACPEYLIKRIAAVSSGDARVAIQTLRNAAESAERAGREIIKPSDLVAGWHDTQQIKTSQILARLTEDHRILYRAVRKHNRMLSTELRQAYVQYCSRVNRNPIAVRTFSAYVNRLVRLGLLSCERARVKGNVRLLRPAERR